MGIGVSIFLIALGAILKFAVTATVVGIEIDVVGVILMIVGGVGLLIALFFLTREDGDGYARRERVVERDPHA